MTLYIKVYKHINSIKFLLVFLVEFFTPLPQALKLMKEGDGRVVGALIVGGGGVKLTILKQRTPESTLVCSVNIRASL